MLFTAQTSSTYDSLSDPLRLAMEAGPQMHPSEDPAHFKQVA